MKTTEDPEFYAASQSRRSEVEWETGLEPATSSLEGMCSGAKFGSALQSLKST